MDLATSITSALEAALGPEKVISDPPRLARYRGVAWGMASSKVPLARPPARAMVAVRPETTEDVVRVIELAGQSGTPIVPHGAGTGVAAGAAPVEGAILLDLGAMRRIHSISREDRLARVDPGVVLGDLDEEAEPHHLMVCHDPWSRPIASVGGATSTNGVGYMAGRYGSMGEQVLGMEVVLATGEVVQIPAVPKASTGPMLRHLFIGAEGVFGVITRVDVRLFPIPERRALVGYRYRRFEDGLAVVMEMMDLQLRPMMIDYEEDDPWDEAPAVGRLVPRQSPMYLAFDGFREEVDANLARVDELCRRHGGTPDHEGAQHFWEHRHDSAYRWLEQLRTDPDSLGINRAVRRWTSSYINVCLPASQVQPYRERAAAELAPYRLVVKDAGLWGVPELLSVRFEHQDPDAPEAPFELDTGTDLGLRLAHELGGSMEYCHGVGLRLAHLMDSEWGAGLEALRRMKQALDPQGILNPGKLGL